jgi:hypothetical protein
MSEEEQAVASRVSAVRDHFQSKANEICVEEKPRVTDAGSDCLVSSAQVDSGQTL